MQFVNYRDAAKHVGVHYVTLHRYVRTGQMPRTCYVGERWHMFHKVNLDKWAAERDSRQ